jgi:hypothetical protein
VHEREHRKNDEKLTPLERLRLLLRIQSGGTLPPRRSTR